MYTDAGRQMTDRVWNDTLRELHFDNIGETLGKAGGQI